jgi:hypothetical protein
MLACIVDVQFVELYPAWLQHAEMLSQYVLARVAANAPLGTGGVEELPPVFTPSEFVLLVQPHAAEAPMIADAPSQVCHFIFVFLLL